MGLRLYQSSDSGNTASLAAGESAASEATARTLAAWHRATLYDLDEPTMGFHFADVYKLLDIPEQACRSKATVVIIEHNTRRPIKSADHVIDSDRGGPGRRKREGNQTEDLRGNWPGAGDGHGGVSEVRLYTL